MSHIEDRWSKIESPTDFSSFSSFRWKKNPSVRPPIDFQSLLLIFLDNASLRKKGGRKKKKKNTKKRRKRDRLLCEPSLLSGQIEFLQSWRGRGGRKGCTESVQEWKRHDLFLSRTQHRKVRFFCSMQKVSGIVEGFRGAERKVRRKEEGDGYPKGWKERRKASRLRKKVQSASRLILEEERYTDLVSAQRLSVVSHSISWR